MIGTRFASPAFRASILAGARPGTLPVPRPRVEGEAVAGHLTATWKALQHHAVGVTRDARHAGPHREKVWDVALELCAARPRGGDLARLRAPLMALRDFVDEFGPYRDTGDERLQNRIFVGAARPGLLRLLEDVVAAAGMPLPPGVDHSIGGN